MNPSLRDADLKKSIALPNGAAAVTSAGLQVNAAGYTLDATMEILIEAPALVVGDLANGETIKYEIQQATDAAFTSPTSVYGVVLTQTGAGGAGAAASTKRVRLPTDVQAYVRLKATNSGAGDASDKSASFSLLF